MVPVSLRLRNFLSYGEDVPPLDFTQFSLACLSGANGHGKSALLDGITWALWRRARKAGGAGAPDAGLLRIGATEMDVEFTFDLEGERYRVHRRYAKARRTTHTRLDFYLYDRDQDRWVSLTQPEQEQTQQRINQTLRMDYDTFVNSAFLLQGRADEFTRKSPSERKEILAKILGLDHYDELCELARQRTRQAEAETNNILTHIQEREEELVRRSDYESQLSSLETDLEKLTRQLSEVQADLSRLQERRAEIGQRQQLANQLQRQLQGLQVELQRLLRQIAEHVKSINNLQSIVARRSQIESDYQRYQLLSRRSEAMTRQLSELRKLEQEKSLLEKAIQQAKAQVERELAGWQSKREQAMRILEEAQSLLRQAEEIEAGYAELLRLRGEDEQWELKRRERDGWLERQRDVEQKLQAEENKLKVELETVRQRYKDLKAKADEEPERKLAMEEALRQIQRLEQLQQQNEQIRRQLEAINQRLSHMQAQLQTLEKEIAETIAKQELLRTATEPRCPLCESELDEQRRQWLDEKLSAQARQRQAELEELLANQRSTETERTNLEKLFRRREQELLTLPQAQKAFASAQNSHEEALKAKEELVKVEQRGKSLRKQLDERRFAPELQAEAERIQKELERVGYDEVKHQLVKSELTVKQSFEREKALLDKAHQDAQSVRGELPQIDAQILSLQSALDSQLYAPNERAALRQLEESIARIGYNPKEHQQIHEQLQGLEKAPRLYEQLQQADWQIEELRKQKTELEESRQEREQQVSEVNDQLIAIRKELEQLNEVEEQLAEVERRRQTLLDEHSVKRTQLGRVQESYERCLRYEQEVKELRERQKEVEKAKRIYAELAKAFSKDGIPALIIENTVPEIEAEANAILSRLTDNRTQVSIELQRELQRGGTRETLDVKIADEMGTRAYELFSGGEAFRVDFALRIAISKLLARRAGTKLRTLVIDEGFGTQDADGLRQMVDAIQTISSEFDKILVITHIDQLKNSFPVRIEVTKHPDIGSKYEVVRG